MSETGPRIVPLPPIRLVKVGGSLYDLPDLATRLSDWLARQHAGFSTILLSGCGDLADVIRRWQPRFGWSDAQSHFLCLDLLDVAAHTLHTLCPHWPLVSHWPDAPQTVVLPDLSKNVLANELAHDPPNIASPGIFIWQPRRWLLSKEPAAPGLSLPRNWHSTTDSVAARAAQVGDVAELILLKSVLPPAPYSRQNFEVAADYVDRHFWQAAGRLPVVRFVNFCENDFPERQV